MSNNGLVVNNRLDIAGQEDRVGRKASQSAASLEPEVVRAESSIVEDFSGDEADLGSVLPPIAKICAEVNTPVTTDEEARLLDRNLRRAKGASVAFLIAYGAFLARMKASKAYLRCGHSSWTDYLASLQESQGKLSYLLKLGQAGDLSNLAKSKVGVTVAQAYAAAVPRKYIAELVEDTLWDVEQATTVEEAKTRIAEVVNVDLARWGRTKPLPDAWIRSDGGAPNSTHFDGPMVKKGNTPLISALWDAYQEYVPHKSEENYTARREEFLDIIANFLDEAEAI